MENKIYDVIIAGGSISGLLCAREIARCNLSVLVLEEDSEIGTPEHCGGLVSLQAMKKLGIIPSSRSILYYLNKAKISSPSKSFEIMIKHDNLAVLDRREFDKQLALQSQRFGADIQTKNLVTSINYDPLEKKFVIRSNNCLFSSEFFVDARGISSLIRYTNRNGLLQSAQYEIYADISDDEILVKFDKEKYPHFFAWIIPMGQGRAKVGVAGSKINALQTLEMFISSLGVKYSAVRKIYAPIWVGGPLGNFINKKNLLVGDAAGQTKPTTAGGIFSCGMGGILAGNSIVKYKRTNKKIDLYEYERKWFSIFGKEFRIMLLFRKFLERLDNKSLDNILSVVTDTTLDEISQSTSFDFHSFAISKILGTKKSMKLVATLMGNEVRHMRDLYTKI